MVQCSCGGDCKSNTNSKKTNTPIQGDYVCYCNKVTEQDITNAILEQGCSSVNAVIKATGAMKNSNCAVNNPKGVCCYEDIVSVFKKYYKGK